ncbi:MAG: alpha-L-rhamnosidase C-terminal domain-containing protein [Chitinophagales bacterium]
MNKICFLFVALSFFYASKSQQPGNDILQKKWDAYWLAVPNTAPHDYGVHHFRKSFALDQPPSSFIIHVSADNRYKLYVNGTMVSFGPARSDVYNWNYETVDIARWLQPGKNVLAAVVWDFGEERQEAQITYQTAFILQGNSATEKMVNSNSSWLCIKDNAYSPLQPQLIYTYYAAGPTEKIDYNYYPDGWTTINYNDASWKPAQQLFNGLPKGVFFWTLGWMLVPRTIPQMEITEQRLEQVRSSTGMTVTTDFLKGNNPFTVPANTKVSLILDQSFLTTAYPVLSFSKGKNALISLSYAEGLYVIENDKTDWRAQRQKGNRNEITGKRFVGLKDELISAGKDEQVFISLMWRTYRYVKLDIETKDESLRINDMYGLFEGYPFQFNAAFKADDKTLNGILETGWRTARLCAHETYMDCPYYEQLQYVGDTRIQALVSLYNSGDDRLMRNAIDQVRNSFMPEGITMSRYPTAHSQQIPTFSLIWISMLHDYWMYRGDANFIRSQLPVARMVLHFFEQYQQKDGSLKNVPYWNFTDWVSDKGWNAGMAPLSKDGTSAALDLQLLMAYQAAAFLEKQTGMPSFADRWTKHITQLKQSIKSNYWSSSNQLFSDTKEKETYSQHCNSLAILTDVINGTGARMLAEKMISDTGISKATVYFRYYLHRALNKAGLGNKYLDMLSKWKENLAIGMTTWAETDDINLTRSDCHAWGSSPNIELFRIVIGIDSDAPGFSKVRIEPHPGQLKNISGHMPHPKGKIAVDYKQTSTGKWSFSIQLPSGISGNFVWKGKQYGLREGKNLFEL